MFKDVLSNHPLNMIWLSGSPSASGAMSSRLEGKQQRAAQYGRKDAAFRHCSAVLAELREVVAASMGPLEDADRTRAILSRHARWISASR